MSPARILRWSAIPLLCLAVGGGAQQRPTEEPAKPATLPEPPKEAAAEPVDPAAYEIGPDDVLDIRVWREPELSKAVVVRPDGHITLPLVRDVKAAGLTPDGLTKELTRRLGEFINKPDVLVAVLAVRSKKYMVSGEVGQAGWFPLIQPTTVLEALVRAGGLREFANKKKIVIMRGDKRLFFNYNEVIKGKNLQQNILIQNNDHIVVQ